jgi:hypothetical protein
MVPFDLKSLVASPLFVAWQRAAADPRLLRLGTGMLRAQLLWARSWQSAVAASWAPIDALAHAADQNDAVAQ